MIRATDLMGCEVRTESGEKLGRVHDLRAHSAGDDGGWLLMGIVVGRGGLRERFEGGADEPVRSGGNVVPWEAITRLSDGVVTVRDVVASAPDA
jgi:sporulation protein YlmC with PRC-barrel domain